MDFYKKKQINMDEKIMYYIYHIPGKKVGVTRNLIDRVTTQQGYSPDDETAVDSSGPIPREGTVGFREPSRAYGVAGRNRTLRFPTSEHPDWEVHPDVPEGDYIRSLSPIPMTGVTTVDKWTVDK